MPRDWLSDEEIARDERVRPWRRAEAWGIGIAMVLASVGIVRSFLG